MIQSFSFQVIIQLTAPKLAPMMNRAQNIGSKFILLCSTQEGSHPLFFDWFKNGQLISSVQTKYKVEKSSEFSTIHIDKIDRSDAGNYSCLVKNKLGTDTQNVVLSVKGKWQFLF